MSRGASRACQAELHETGEGEREQAQSLHRNEWKVSAKPPIQAIMTEWALKMQSIRSSSWICAWNAWNCLSWLTAPLSNNYVKAVDRGIPHYNVNLTFHLISLMCISFTCRIAKYNSICCWWSRSSVDLPLMSCHTAISQLSERQASQLVKVIVLLSDTTLLVITCPDDKSKELREHWCRQMKSWLDQINH